MMGTSPSYGHHQLIESRGVGVEVVFPEDGPSDGFIQQTKVNVSEPHVDMAVVPLRVAV